MNIFNNKREYQAFMKAWSKAFEDGKLTSVHHVLRNLALGHPTHRGFTPTTNHNKLNNGYAINRGLYLAEQTLSKYQQADKSSQTVSRFLESLGGTITPEMLESIEFSPVKEISPKFGTGYKIAKYIMDHNNDTITYDRITELMVEYTNKAA